MTARRTEDHARVLVFIDGQNVYKGCYENFGRPHCHPLLLSRWLAGNRRLVGVRYYSGLHDPRVNPELNATVQRRHALMRQTGVTVVERRLRYRWEWGLRQRDLPDPQTRLGEELQVTVTPYQRAREKGIDVALALDVIDLAQRNLMDTAVVVSSDTDLCEVARVVHDTTRPSGRVSVEAAVVRGGRRRIIMEHYDYTHQIGPQDFLPMSDEFDYRVPLDTVAVVAFLETCRNGSTLNWSI